MARRRPAARRAKNVRRSTPRRWLPFLLLVAVVAAAVVVSRQVRDDEATVTLGRDPASLLPVAAADRPVSSTWYCTGGSASGEGPAELSVIIANAADHGARADITLVGPDDHRTVSVRVPAHGTLRRRAEDLLPGDWVAMTVEVLGGSAAVERAVSGPDGFDLAPCSSSASASWYVPSGSTLRGATERLVLYNPFPSDTSVDIRFATEAGTSRPSDTQGISVPGHSLRVVTVENPSRRREVAAWVTTRAGLVVVDRIQRFDGSGDPVPAPAGGTIETDAPRGIVSTPAVPATASRWLFPEARWYEGGRLYLSVFNPGREVAVLDLQLGYEGADQFPEAEPVEVRVRPGREVVVDLSERPDVYAGIGLSLDLRSTSGPPVAAEVTMTMGTAPEPTEEEPPPDEGTDTTEPSPDAGPPAEEAPAGSDAPAGDTAAGPAVVAPGVAVSAGSPVAATDWFLAAGGRPRTPRHASVTVLNPGTRPAKVTVTQYSGGRQRAVPGAAVTLAPGERRTLDLSKGGFDDPLVIHADHGVVVARLVTIEEGRGLALALAEPFRDRVVPLR